MAQFSEKEQQQAVSVHTLRTFYHDVNSQDPHFPMEIAKTPHGGEHPAFQVSALPSALENRFTSLNLVWHFLFN